MIQIFRHKDYKTTEWSGGKTTELCIYPFDANFKERNFNFRISTATVEVDYSVFTPLEGISRTLMVLDGNITLSHKNQHKKELKPFEVDKFEGSWQTESFGTCSDFNLMTKNISDSKMKYIKAEGIVEIIDWEIYDLHFIYVLNGEIEIKESEKEQFIETKDSVLIDLKSKPSIKSINSSELVICSIKL